MVKLNTIELPIYWTQTYKTKKDKIVLLSMNWYRNAHYYAKNQIKKDYHELVYNQAKNVKLDGTFKLFIQLYYKNPSCDGSNISSILEKFVLDALQEENIIVNDNVKYHLGTTWEIVQQDKNNPRALISLIK